MNKNIIVFSLCCLVALGIGVWQVQNIRQAAAERDYLRQNPPPKIERTHIVSGDQHNPDVYVKIGPVTMRFAQRQIYSLMKEGEHFSVQSPSSFDNPIDVDRFSFSHNILIPGYELKYSVQYKVALSRYSVDAALKRVEDELVKRGKKIEDLQQESGFYKFVRDPNYATSIEYISMRKQLERDKEEPLILKNCFSSQGKSFLRCDAYFSWHSSINILALESALHDKVPQADSIDVWLTAFPIYVEELNKYVVKIEEE